MKEIKLISEYYYPEEPSTGYYIKGIAEGLAKDTNLTVIYTSSNASSIIREQEAGLKKIIVPSINIDKNKLLPRLYRLLVLSIRLLSRYLKEHRKGETVICVTNPAFIVPLIALYKRWNKKFKLVFLVHDVFPENLVASGIVKRTNILYKLILRIYNSSYSKADSIVTCGRDMRELFIKKTGAGDNSPTIEYIPNWGDINSITPIENYKDLIRKEYKLQNKLTFQFAGNIGRLQGIPNILESLKSIDYKDIAFVFYGKGACLDDILEANDSRVIYGGSFDKEESQKYLNLCDISVVCLQKGMTGLGVPSKTYSNLAAGKPILYVGEPEDEIAQVIAKEEIGYVCDLNEPGSIKRGINWFYSLDDYSYNLLSKNSREVAEKLFSQEKVIDQYCSFIKSN
ncbi:glycosyltransferase family 4 protein [Marinifilum flexuosum]|uniref:Glycosyl transferase family 4 n=1 Tax=Marinifilum flexuosum TaxID=1117708 RepID=A0A419XA18_9BACT|nr:glycosyltransferase family 4 protein [Marinifilum flexuosum]RKE04608.1 glycosyl transferase family 4 [Marinifilum flexuosum]